MTAAENKQMMRSIYEELEKGNGAPFLEALAPDVRWTIKGSSAWSRTWEGLDAVRARLLKPLMAQFADGYRARALQVLADGDHVVIESRGDATTKTGKPYRNSYCLVFRLEGGKVRELIEYCDTALVNTALDAPEQVAA
jgi:uncharacterized protein